MTCALPQAEAAPRGAAGAPILSVQAVSKTFRIPSVRRGQPNLLHAVRDVSFELATGRTLGIVGESGCGKSTLSRLIVGTLEPTAGRILIDGQDVAALRGRQRLDVLRQVQMVFQSPYASLDPRMTIGDIVREPLDVHESRMSRSARQDLAVDMLTRVGLSSDHAGRYPHELSGGQRQRVGIARALVQSARLVICDEPVSSLDVSVQAQVINLLRDLQAQMNISYVFVSHDLAVVASMADDIAVMYMGRVVELGSATEVLRSPRHPYTQVLVDSSNVPDPAIEKHRSPRVLTGDLPNPMAPPSGCPFRTRCWRAAPECAAELPRLMPRGDAMQSVACHFA